MTLNHTCNFGVQEDAWFQFLPTVLPFSLFNATSITLRVLLSFSLLFAALTALATFPPFRVMPLNIAHICSHISEQRCHIFEHKLNA